MAIHVAGTTYMARSREGESVRKMCYLRIDTKRTTPPN